MSGVELQRLGTIMEPEPGNPQEIEGVLNPAASRGPDGQLYLFPRLVAKGNYSRIGIARVRFNEAGDPTGVERLGIALEPEADYERRPDGGGGCEDPRVTFVEPLQHYIMTYTAYSPRWPADRAGTIERSLPLEADGTGEVCSVARHRTRRRGRQRRQLLSCRDSEPIRASGAGAASPAALSRHSAGGNRLRHVPRIVDLDRESIWISYCSPTLEGQNPDHLRRFTSHHRLATPVSPWERLKIGAGTPPILTRHGWLILYHGVSEIAKPDSGARHLCYSAGVMVLSEKHPQVIRYRSAEPALKPELPAGMPGDDRQCCVSNRHRSPRRPRLAGPLRHLLRHGRQSDRRSASGSARGAAGRRRCGSTESDSMIHNRRALHQGVV